jgi:hypothetical protein
MPIAYPVKKNKRAVGAELAITNEPHVIGISGAFTNTPNKIRLIEVPLQEEPSTVIVLGSGTYTEVDVVLSPYEFSVDYGIGRITFHPDQNGEGVFVSYKGRGSEVDSEDVNELDIPVGVALNSDGTLSDFIVRPNNISNIITDDFAFPRHVTTVGNLTVGGDVNVGSDTLTLNTAQLGAPTLDAFFTVNRGTSGDVSLKWNETIDAWEFLDDLGSPVFQIFNNGDITLGGPLLIGDGTISNPAYAFASETDLGFYKSASGVIDFVNDSSQVLTIGDPIRSHFRHLFTDGTVALPGISFFSENTGWYLAGASNPALSVVGVQTLDVNVPTGYLTSALRFLVPAGTDLLPSLSFSVDPDTGLYNSLSDQLSVTLGGVATTHFTATALHNLVKFQAPDGTPLAPSYTFTSLPGSGMTSDFGNLTFSVDGFGEAGRFSTVGDFHIQPGRKVIFDGFIGEAFWQNLAGGLIGQSATDASLALRSPNYFSLEANAFSTGQAIGTIRVVNYSDLLTDTLTISGIPITEGVDWFAATDNATTATSIVDAINDPLGPFVGIVTAAIGAGADNVITIIATVAGEASESITIATSDPVNLLVYDATLQGGGVANTREPSISLNTNGSIDILNSSQGHETNRVFSVRMTQEMGMGYHRTLQVTPKDVGIGVAATATVVVFDYTVLTGATLTVGGIFLTEGIDWDAMTSNNDTATDLAASIDALTTVSASAVGNVITIFAEDAGSQGNEINLITSDPMNLITSGSFLHDGADDFVVGFGYESDGTDVIASTIDTHGSLPLVFTIDDTEVARIAPTVVTLQQPLNMSSNTINDVADPIADQDAATKAYVDSVAAGLDPKASVRVATLVAGTLASDFEDGDTIDGIVLATGDRLLIKNQADPIENGIYTVNASGAPTRSTDMDGTPSNEVSGGNFTFVEGGTQAGTGWVVVWDGDISVGVDPINWTQFSQPSYAFAQFSSDPISPATGQVWFNTTDNQFKGYNGTGVVILG